VGTFIKNSARDEFYHQDIHPIRWILGMLLERPLLFLWIIIGIIAHQSLRFTIPVLLGDLIEFGINANNPKKVKFYATLILIIGFISAFLDLVMSWGNEIAANDVEYKTRKIYFKSIQRKNMAFYDQARMGELMSVAQNDLRAVYQTVAPGLRLFGEAVTSIIVVLILITIESWVLGALFLMMLPVWLYALVKYNNRITPAAIKQQDDFRDLSARVKENLVGAKVVRAMAQEDNEIKEFAKFNDSYTKSWEHRGKVTAFFVPMLLTYSMAGIIFLVGAYLATNSTITVFGLLIQTNFDVINLITVMAIMVIFRQPTFFVGAVLEMSSLGFAGVVKVQNTIQMGEYEHDLQNSDKLEFIGEIQFDRVNFEIDGNKILEDVSFTINQGETVALVGPPGSGKTSLIKLLTRFYEPNSGQIRLDTHNIQDIGLQQLRESIGVVEQEIHLFSTTIGENLTYAFDKNQVNQGQLEDVIKRARIDEFINQLPDGLDTVVGERGVRLSGGQRQRIAIARAFLIDPIILVLDDSTSAIDGKTENEIVSAMQELMENRTTILITNRLNMMKKADKIIVLNQGKLVGIGQHDELIKNNPIYRRIFQPYLDTEGTMK